MSGSSHLESSSANCSAALLQLASAESLDTARQTHNATGTVQNHSQPLRKVTIKKNQSKGTANTQSQTVAPPLPLGSPRAASIRSTSSAVLGESVASGAARAEALASRS